jgi:hypothetical protein
MPYKEHLCPIWGTYFTASVLLHIQVLLDTKRYIPKARLASMGLKMLQGEQVFHDERSRQSGQ